MEHATAEKLDLDDIISVTTTEVACGEADQPGGCGGVLHPLQFTDDALELAREQLTRRGTPEAFIRLGVRGGGCAGLKYEIAFDDDPPTKRDRVLDRGGVRFIVDRKSLIVLTGSVLATEENGLMSRGFSFQNPKAKSSCGCGKSFTM